MNVCANMEVSQVTINDTTPTLIVAARRGRKKLFIKSSSYFHLGPTSGVTTSNGYYLDSPQTSTPMSDLGREFPYDGDVYGIVISGTAIVYAIEFF